MKYFVAINLALNKVVQIRIIKSIVFRKIEMRWLIANKACRVPLKAVPQKTTLTA